MKKPIFLGAFNNYNELISEFSKKKYRHQIILIDNKNFKELNNCSYIIKKNSKIRNSKPDSINDEFEREYLVKNCLEHTNFLLEDLSSRRACFTSQYINELGYEKNNSIYLENTSRCITSMQLFIRFEGEDCFKRHMNLVVNIRSQNLSNNIMYDFDTFITCLNLSYEKYISLRKNSFEVEKGSILCNVGSIHENI